MSYLHCLDVGCADASVIATDTATVLVDCHRIDEYRHLLPRNRHLRGVIITHPHHDHYSGLEFLRQQGFSIECLIHSPYQRRRDDASLTYEEWTEFESLREHFASRGTRCYAPYRQDSFAAPYWTTDGLRFWVLGPTQVTATRATREVHDACLVMKAQIGAGGRACLFTGDASDTNLQDVARLDNICDDILHASHHGSIEGADLGFIQKCRARYTVISTAPGTHDNVPHPIALRRYSENTAGQVYRTDVSGTVRFTF